VTACDSHPHGQGVHRFAEGAGSCYCGWFIVEHDDSGTTVRPKDSDARYASRIVVTCSD
jgi:hypothetical protein